MYLGAQSTLGDTGSLKKPNRRWTFEKSYLHESPLQEQDFPRNQGSLG